MAQNVIPEQCVFNQGLLREVIHYQDNQLKPDLDFFRELLMAKEPTSGNFCHWTNEKMFPIGYSFFKTEKLLEVFKNCWLQSYKEAHNTVSSFRYKCF